MIMNELKTYQPRNKVRRAFGFVCLAIAIAPNGLAPVFYPAAFYLLEIKMEDVKNKIYDIKVRVKYGK